ncbi:AAA family ATPase [Flavobacterium sp. LAR06]|uniref:AAA family ATPase n=1 Tax=Flavobacterium sp. LAR06 TaxID=3064897 RepID=UPI0035BEF9C4
MRIKSLWVSEYKNLKNIDLKFNSNLITLLVGKNGVGKSNLIEILGLLFKNFDLLNTEEEFVYWEYGNERKKFQYSINYECYDDDILIECTETNFTISTRALASGESIDFKILDFKEFIKNRKTKYIPKYIIGYYSGENKRIRNILKEHEDQQKDILKNFHRKKKEEQDSGLRRMLFTENHHSQLLLLTLVLFREDSNFKDKIDDLLKNYLGIENIENFSILFNNPDWDYKNVDGKDRGMDYLISNIGDKEEVKNPFWNVKGKINWLLTRLYNHQIDNSSEPIYYDNEGDDERRFVKEFLLFDKIKFDVFIDEVTKYYKHPIDFFDALESTTIIDILKAITFKVRKKDIKDLIEFDQLSEGEQQLLTVFGLLLVVGTDECLFLLDEPDTHLNPDWQRDYIELLKRFNTNSFDSHIFVATHSPLIVQNSVDSEILLHRKEDNEIIIEESEIEFDTWRIDHVLTSKYFGLESARPKNKKTDSFFAMRKLFLEGKLSDEEKEKMKELRIGHLFPSGETYNDLIVLSKILKEDDPN